MCEVFSIASKFRTFLYAQTLKEKKNIEIKKSNNDQNPQNHLTRNLVKNTNKIVLYTFLMIKKEPGKKGGRKTNNYTYLTNRHKMLRVHN